MAAPSDVASLFPHASILATHPIGHAPTYDTLRPAFTQLNANAASIPSRRGDSTLGHIVLTIGPVRYSEISQGNVPHPAQDRLPKPGPPGNSTAAAIAEAHKQYTTAETTFATYHATDAALKKQLLAATDEQYVLALKDEELGFTKCTTRNLIEHLLDNYGTITNDDYEANNECMCAPWDATTPIEPLFEQIDKGIAYAIAAGSPFTSAQLISLGYTLINKTDCLALTCHDWCAQPPAKQMWQNFKYTFQAAYRDANLGATTASTGYAGQMQPRAPSPQESSGADIYLANLLTNQAQQHSTLSALTQAIATLQAQINATKHSPANAGPKCNTHAPNPQRLTQANADHHYCWTHGGMVTATHTSATCERPAPGHKKTATYLNRQGSSNLHCGN